MKRLSVADVVDLFLKNQGIAALMQTDGNTGFWSYSLSNRLMGWISELDDDDGQLVTASITFGKLSEGYESGETLWLLKTTFSPSEPFHFVISEVGLCSLGFELGSGDSHLLRLLEQLHRSAIDFPHETADRYRATAVSLVLNKVSYVVAQIETIFIAVSDAHIATSDRFLGSFIESR